MSAMRQDAWTSDDDLILAEVTLRQIREGGTQLTAFEEVGERIGRTAAACGFRWNSFVRKQYESAIQLAKEQRQKRNHSRKSQSMIDDTSIGRVKSDSDETMSMDAVIRYLRQWKHINHEQSRQLKQLEKELHDREEELNQLRSENNELKKNVNTVEMDYRMVNDDYKALIQIMDRARKLAFLSEDVDDNKPRFKMDVSGNLERID